MKKVGLFLFLVSLLSVVGFVSLKQNEKSKGFAVVELFSSEGCSSCPPAEVVMKKLIDKANSQSLPICVLEFHVDYWDYLGWKDNFASPEYTGRQQAYKEHFNLESMYTPQAVVNGKTEMTGSDESAINNAVNKELQQANTVSLTCTVSKINDTKLKVNYNINGDIKGCVLNIALVQSGISVSILRGENKGKTLVHDNVVRVFKSIAIQAGSGEYDLDVTSIPPNTKLICFVQNSTDMGIHGACQANIGIEK